jgi:hypothetical protein
MKSHQHALPRIVDAKNLVLALLLVAGCSDGPPVGKVQGKLTVGNQPLTAGSVIFENRDTGVAAQAALGSDGGYVIRFRQRDGLPPGTYQVAVTPSTIGTGEAPLVVPNNEPPPASPIPEKYRTIKTSGLTATVKAGDNPPFDFNLTP